MHVLNPGDKLNVGILRVGAKFPFQLLFHIRKSVWGKHGSLALSTIENPMRLKTDKNFF